MVPHEVKAQGSASLAALSALCMYLKRCNANSELATGTHKVAISNLPLFMCLLMSLVTPIVVFSCHVRSPMANDTPDVRVCQHTCEEPLTEPLRGMLYCSGGALCCVRWGSVPGRPHADQPGALGKQRGEQRRLSPGLPGHLRLSRSPHYLPQHTPGFAQHTGDASPSNLGALLVHAADRLPRGGSYVVWDQHRSFAMRSHGCSLPCAVACQGCAEGRGGVAVQEAGGLLRQWMCRPLRDIAAINGRLDAVQELVTRQELVVPLRAALQGAHVFVSCTWLVRDGGRYSIAPAWHSAAQHSPVAPRGLRGCEH